MKKKKDFLKNALNATEDHIILYKINIQLFRVDFFSA